MASKYLPLFIAIFFAAQTFAHHHHNHTDGHDHTDDLIIPGGPSEISVNSPEIVGYVGKAEKGFSAEYPGDNHPKVKEIIKVTKQTVAGSLYKINVTFGTSDCPKSKEFTHSCALLKDTPVKECEIKAWIKSWENFEEIKVTCKE